MGNNCRILKSNEVENWMRSESGRTEWIEYREELIITEFNDFERFQNVRKFFLEKFIIKTIF